MPYHYSSEVALVGRGIFPTVIERLPLLSEIENGVNYHRPLTTEVYYLNPIFSQN